MEKLLEQVLQERYHKTIKEASSQEIYTALLLITKDKMKNMKRNEGKKKLYYISAEFLIGKLLSNNLINLGLFEETREVLEKNGHHITDIEEIEQEPSLGKIRSRIRLLETAVLDVWQHVFWIPLQRWA